MYPCKHLLVTALLAESRSFRIDADVVTEVFPEDDFDDDFDLIDEEDELLDVRTEFPESWLMETHEIGYEYDKLLDLYSLLSLIVTYLIIIIIIITLFI